MLGEDVAYELDWCSIYTFQCRRMEKFRHGRVIFAGDSAHQVSPFGARGANSGIQDADNLGWKLDLVLKGLAPDSLLDSYDTERAAAADENILNSTRSTDFMTPKTEISHAFRNAVLDLAQNHPFARPLVNSGRLSVPTVYDDLPLNGPDELNGPDRSRPGAPCPDAPVGDGFLLDKLGDAFTLLTINTDAHQALEIDGVTVTTLALELSEMLADRFLGPATQAVYLIRPDQHVIARWSAFDRQKITTALMGALGKVG
jgi:3-(3-hydroxy-phenyl)propionate hydroxylase